ncbi:hypothetical protein FPZ43_03700 [Mucilaginibacter pallidiroseus]|uniref:Uncharacterized protein n=1 Tax=Mucilaginibacter pallidiroseus TaxID=2599295 RepID=A0A563UJZ0_9SPHI|nr:hypothetical protein [Mucilaginibacter pallidiroseus]TWR31588.1 hypothetical protein FPZ43_03700 [Mucilaginibacter pallidiroseus]
MENKPEGFDRANNQGQNLDTAGNIANVNNDTLKQEDNDLAKEIPTVTPETVANGVADDGSENNEQEETPNDTPELENPTNQSSSNKGQGPGGENL